MRIITFIIKLGYNGGKMGRVEGGMGGGHAPYGKLKLREVN